MNEEIKLYTVQEVAELLKVSRQTVYNYLTAGRLRGTKLRREFRIRERDLREFLDAGEAPKEKIS